MVDTDENGMVKAINRFFQQNNLQGIAYRRKQHRFTSQFLDIMVDSAEDDIVDVAFEHKSWKTKSSKKLYFSQHFSDNTQDDFLNATHQVERVQEFKEKSGYEVYLAAEVRRGPGKPIKLFILPWTTVVERYENYKEDGSCAGFSPEWFEENALEVGRSNSEWQIPKELFTKESV